MAITGGVGPPTVDELICVRLREDFPGDGLGVVRVGRRDGRMDGEEVSVLVIEAFLPSGTLVMSLREIWSWEAMRVWGPERTAELAVRLWMLRYGVSVLRAEAEEEEG